jgi:hypothetical protein
MGRNGEEDGAPAARKVGCRQRGRRSRRGRVATADCSRGGGGIIERERFFARKRIPRNTEVKGPVLRGRGD